MQPRDWILIRPKSENSGMQDFLSASQRCALKLAHRMERDRKICDSMKIVLLADQGESFAEIAKFLFLDEQIIRRYLKDYFDNCIFQPIVDSLLQFVAGARQIDGGAGMSVPANRAKALQSVKRAIEGQKTT